MKWLLRGLLGVVLRLVVLVAVLALGVAAMEIRRSQFGCLLLLLVLGMMPVGGLLIEEPYNIVVVALYAGASAFLVRLTVTYLRAMKRDAATSVIRLPDDSS